MLNTLERIERGGQRLVSSLPGLEQWQRERRAAREARAEGGTALFAVALDSPEGDIQASHQRSAWTAQIKLIEQAEHRNRSQELLLRQLRRNVRDLDEAEARRHPTPENMAGRRLAAFGPVGAPLGLIGMLGGVRLWMVLASGMALTTGAAAIQTARLNHAKHDLTDAQRDLRTAVHNRDEWQHAYTRQGELLESARRDSAATSANLHRLEQLRAASAAAERRRQHDIENIRHGIGDPPDLGLRDDARAVQSAPATAAPTAGGPR